MIQTVIYSSSAAFLKTLRTGKDGLLRVDNGIAAGQGCTSKGCASYVYGDNRAIQTPQLMLCHTFFVLLHNVIAKELKKGHPTYKDDQLFDEARRLNIDLFNNIVYNHWLPEMIGMRGHK